MTNWFDITISLLLLAAFVRGMQKGVVMQLVGFAAIIIGGIFAGKVAKVLLPLLLDTINISLNVAVVISYIVAFTLLVFGVKFIGKLIHGLFQTLQIGFINKILGAIVGVGTAMVPYLNRDLWEQNIPERYRPKDDKDKQINLPKELHL